MRLKDTGLTAQDIKDKVKKYMIETYERFDFIAETAEGMYLYDENGTPYLDFYAGIAVNNAGSRNPKVVAAVKDQVDDIMHREIWSKQISHRNCKGRLPWQNLRCYVSYRTAWKRMPGGLWSYDIRFLIRSLQ